MSPVGIRTIRFMYCDLAGGDIAMELLVLPECKAAGSDLKVINSLCLNKNKCSETGSDSLET